MGEVTTQALMVRRYVKSTYEPDDRTYDIVWTDRVTNRVVLSYDGADPANTSPAYGAESDEDVFKRKGLDIREEVEIGRCIVPVDPREAERLIADNARRAEREAEEAAATDLMTLLGNEATDFDFGAYSKGENEILRPALKRRGFTDVSFYMGEQDSFGPLSRGCVARAPNGKRVRFYYG